MSVPRIQFGSAYAEYPTGPLVDWQTGVSLRRRAEQRGANVGTFGKEPRPYSIMAMIFGNTVAGMRYRLGEWYQEKGNVKVIRIDGPMYMRGVATALLSVDPVANIKRIINATNSASYYQWINLVFARVAD